MEISQTVSVMTQNLLNKIWNCATVSNCCKYNRNIEHVWDISPKKRNVWGISDCLARLWELSSSWTQPALETLQLLLHYLKQIFNRSGCWNVCRQQQFFSEISTTRDEQLILLHSNHVCVVISDMTAAWRKKHASGQSNDEPQSLTFISLKPRLIRLLLEALQCESDSFNVQILLGGL